MPLAKNTEEQKLVLESLSEVKTFLSLVYVSRFIDIPELQQTAAFSAIDIATPDEDGKNGFTGEIPKAIIEKCIQVITGPESDYIRESLRKYIDGMNEGIGYVSMFQRKDLTGWKPFIADPIALTKLTPKELKKKTAEATGKMHQNWNVKDGMIVFSGEGDNLLSEKEYGDFEMIVNWRISKKG